MTTENLQYLLPDTTHGYLYPHRAALTALGLPNEYQLNKYRTQLPEGCAIKLRGSDYVERLYYTLEGILRLCDLVNSPQSQHFKAALIAHCRSESAIVPAAPQTIAPHRQPPTALYREPAAAPAVIPEIIAAAPGYLVPPANSNDPAYRLAQHLQPGIERAVHNAIAAATAATAATSPAAPATQPSTSPQDIAEVIFRAQQIAVDHTLQGQRQITQHQAQTEAGLWQKCEHWLNAQEATYISLCAAFIIMLAGLASYALVTVATMATTPRTPTPDQIQP